jgi:hypothetical protein
MKKDAVAFWLIGALLLSTLGTAGMCYTFLRTNQQLRAMQPQLNLVNQRRGLMQALAADLNEYGRRNPSVIPALEQMNIRLRNATVAATNAPGGHQ